MSMDIGADTVRDQLLMLARIVEANLPHIDGELVQLIDQLRDQVRHEQAAEILNQETDPTNPHLHDADRTDAEGQVFCRCGYLMGAAAGLEFD